MQIFEGCYTTWEEMPGRGMCIKEFEQPENWYDARKKCLTTGGDLISIESSAELTFVQSKHQVASYSHILKYLLCITGLMSQSIYIGLNDVFIETEWVWSDGAPTTYTPPWLGSNPDNAGPTSNQDCALLNTGGQMDDVDCSSIAPYICEMRMTSHVFV